MTGHFCKVYEETYKNQLIEIYDFSQFAPGGVGSSYFYAIIDGYRLPGNFDNRSHHPFCAAADTGNPPTSEQSQALAVARAYCDREAEAIERRGDEQLSFSLSYQEAKTLLRALRSPNPTTRMATQNLQARMEALLEEPSTVERTHPTNLVARALAKILKGNRERAKGNSAGFRRGFKPPLKPSTQGVGACDPRTGEMKIGNGSLRFSVPRSLFPVPFLVN